MRRMPIRKATGPAHGPWVRRNVPYGLADVAFATRGRFPYKNYKGLWKKNCPCLVIARERVSSRG